MIDYNGVIIRKIHNGNKFVYTADLGGGTTFSDDTMAGLKEQVDNHFRTNRWSGRPVIEEE